MIWRAEYGRTDVFFVRWPDASGVRKMDIVCFDRFLHSPGWVEMTV